MTLLIFLLVVVIVLWQLLVNGWLWKLVLGIFGWIGMNWALLDYFPETKNVCLSISGYDFSWAQVIPSAVLFMAMLYTKE